MKKLCLLLVLSLFLCSGCVSGKKFTPVTNISNDQSLIYVYRSNAFAGSANDYHIRINGKYINDLGNGEYIPYVTDDKEVQFQINLRDMALPLSLQSMISEPEQPKEVLKLDVLPGKTYYVKFQLGDFSSMGKDSKLILVENEIGLKEVSDCELRPEPIIVN